MDFGNRSNTWTFTKVSDKKDTVFCPYDAIKRVKMHLTSTHPVKLLCMIFRIFSIYYLTL